MHINFPFSQVTKELLEPISTNSSAVIHLWQFLELQQRGRVDV